MLYRIMRKIQKTPFQTKFLIFNLAIYMLAIAWTTFQAYARLEYSRTGTKDSIPTFIHIQPSDPSKG